MSRDRRRPGRPVAKPPRGLPTPDAPDARRRPRGLALAVPVVVLVIVAVALAVAREAPGRPAGVTGTGLTDRTAFLLVRTARTPVQARAPLGPPRASRPADSTGVCWIYGARSGRPITYELCFRRGFLRSKAILPHAVARDRAVTR